MSQTQKPLHPFYHWKARLFTALFMIVLSFTGLIVTEIKQDGAWYYWRGLCIVFALLSISLHLFLRAKESVSYFGTIWQEVFHWLGLLFSVAIISVMVEVGIIGRFVSSIAVLLLLALTTFLAGIYMDITFVFVGVFLGLFALGLAIVSIYLYPIVIPLTVIGVFILWLFLKRKHKSHQQNLKEES
jgi:hypothetical protein